MVFQNTSSLAWFLKPNLLCVPCSCPHNSNFLGFWNLNLQQFAKREEIKTQHWGNIVDKAKITNLLNMAHLQGETEWNLELASTSNVKITPYMYVRFFFIVFKVI